MVSDLLAPLCCRAYIRPETSAGLTYLDLDLDLVPPVLSRTLDNELSPSGTIVGSISRVTPVNTQYVQIFFQCVLHCVSVVFQPSSCHLLVSILRTDWLV